MFPAYGDENVVVGAAIIRDEQLLAACRAYPPSLAGLWELPGGKVEPGETPEAALFRECCEELGVEIRLGNELDGEWRTASGAALRVWLVSIVDGDPETREHSALRWLAADELLDVEWLTADLPVVDELRGLV